MDLSNFRIKPSELTGHLLFMWRGCPVELWCSSPERAYSIFQVWLKKQEEKGWTN